jgi:hypothetical protein
MRHMCMHTLSLRTVHTGYAHVHLHLHQHLHLHLHLHAHLHFIHVHVWRLNHLSVFIVCLLPLLRDGTCQTVTRDDHVGVPTRSPISRASRVHLACISRVSRLYLDCISLAPGCSVHSARRRSRCRWVLTPWSSLCGTHPIVAHSVVLTL